MADKIYIEGLEAIKEDILLILEKARGAEATLSAVEEKSGVEFPYKWELAEIARTANNFVQQIDVDIQAFGMGDEEGQKETPEAEKKEEAIKSLQQLVASM